MGRARSNGASRVTRGGRPGTRRIGGPEGLDFRSIVDLAPVMVWVSDPKGRLTFLNGAWRDFARNGRTSALSGIVHPEDLESMRATYRAAIQAAQPFRCEFQAKRLDGEYRWLQMTGMPVRRDGSVVGFVGMGIDVTGRRRSEQALRESEARYRNLAETIGDPFFTIDRQLVCLYWNSAAAAVTGAPVVDAVNRPLGEVLPGFEGSPLQAFLLDDVASRQRGTVPYMLTRDGGTLHFQAFVYPTRRGVAVLMHDITGRVKAEHALSRSEANYRAIFQSANDAILLFEPHSETILDVNRRACEVYGLTRDELVGRSLKSLTRDVPRGEEQIKQTLRDGHYDDFETVHVRKDGTPIHFRVNASIVEYLGTPAVLSINREVSDRGRAEDYFSRAQSALFERARDAAFIVNPAMQILLANRAASDMTRYAPDAIARMSLPELVHPDDRVSIAAAHERSLGGEEVVVEARLVCADGAAVDVELHNVLMDQSGHRYVQTVVRDVSRHKRAEAELRVNEELLSRMVESTDDIIFLQDAAARYVYYNGAQRYPLTLADVIGKTPDALYPPSIAAEIVHDVLQVARTGESLSRESQMVLGGRTEWFLDQLSPVRDDRGTIAGVMTISRNMTDRKMAEEQLRQSEERYRAFVEGSPDGIWRFESSEPIPVHLPEEEQIDRMFRYGFLAECNDAMARIFDRRGAADVVGTQLSAMIDKSDLLNRENLLTFIRSGYRLSGREWRALGRDGRIRTFVSTMTGVVENGCLVRTWGNLHDITEAKYAERKLRLLAQTITSTKDSIVISDLDGRVLFVNEAFLDAHGFSEEDVLGEDINRVRVDVNPPELLAAIRAGALDGGWNGEIIERRKDGTTFPVELWVSVVRNDEGTPVALVGVARDISERARAEEQIRTSLREKEVLLKEIHHRVKNNLQIVSSLLSLQSEYIRDPDMLKIFKESQSRVKSMALVHEKLYRSSSLAAIDFGEYLRELAAHLFRSYDASERGIELAIETDPVGLGIDRSIPCGIIVNELVSNALKYAFPPGRGGVLTIRLTAPAEGEAELVVSDTGVGLPADLDVQSTDSLGLKLVTMLSMQLRGSLSVEQGSEGGAAFRIRFKTA